MIYKGPLKKRGGGQGDSGDLMVFLFDHALLMVKQKSKPEQHKVYRRVSITNISTDFMDAENLLANSPRTVVDIGPG